MADQKSEDGEREAEASADRPGGLGGPDAGSPGGMGGVGVAGGTASGRPPGGLSPVPADESDEDDG